MGIGPYEGAGVRAVEDAGPYEGVQVDDLLTKADNHNYCLAEHGASKNPVIARPEGPWQSPGTMVRDRSFTEINTGISTKHYRNRNILPGDCHVASLLAMTRFLEVQCTAKR